MREHGGGDGDRSEEEEGAQEGAYVGVGDAK